MSVAQASRRRTGLKSLVIGLLVIAAVVAICLFEINHTRSTRQSMASYYRLVLAGNRQDIETARKYCSTRFLENHSLTLAPEGGLEGLPRGIDQNYKVWKQGNNVWLCPTDLTGPIYQFVQEDSVWKFDGLVGLLRPGHVILPLPAEGRVQDSSESSEPSRAAGQPEPVVD